MPHSRIPARFRWASGFRLVANIASAQPAPQRPQQPPPQQPQQPEPQDALPIVTTPTPLGSGRVREWAVRVGNLDALSDPERSARVSLELVPGLRFVAV